MNRTNTRRTHANVKYTPDSEGRNLAHVECTGTGTPRAAVLYAADFERIKAQGFSTCWDYTLTNGVYRYVQVRAINSRTNRERRVTVARLITRASEGERVRYRDGNRLNLRRENLEIISGKAGGVTNVQYAVSSLQPNRYTPPCQPTA